jgi:serine/threonine protein kinase
MAKVKSEKQSINDPITVAEDLHQLWLRDDGNNTNAAPLMARLSHDLQGEDQTKRVELAKTLIVTHRATHILHDYHLTLSATAQPKLVGAGGFGFVFKALKPRLNLKFQLAIKLLDPQYVPVIDSSPVDASPAGASVTPQNSTAATKSSTEPGRENPLGLLDEHARFVKEIAILRELDHPGLPRVVFEDASFTKQPFYVMNFGGESLYKGAGLRVVFEQDRSLRRLLPLLRSFLEVLTYCHENEVFHRDIKPSNILVCAIDPLWSDRPFQVMLIDFGIAQANSITPNTRAGSKLFGTDWFCHPDPPTPLAADIFSIGRLLHYLIQEWSRVRLLGAKDEWEPCDKKDGWTPKALPESSDDPVASKLIELSRSCVSSPDKPNSLETILEAIVALDSPPVVEQPSLKITPPPTEQAVESKPAATRPMLHRRAVILKGLAASLVMLVISLLLYERANLRQNIALKDAQLLWKRIKDTEATAKKDDLKQDYQRFLDITADHSSVEGRILHARALVDYGRFLRSEGEIDDAKTHLKKAVEEWVKLVELDEIHRPYLGEAYGCLGDASLGDGEKAANSWYDKSKEQRQILRDRPNCTSGDRIQYALALTNTARLAAVQGERKKAGELWQEVFKEYRVVCAKDDPLCPDLRQAQRDFVSGWLDHISGYMRTLEKNKQGVWLDPASVEAMELKKAIDALEQMGEPCALRYRDLYRSLTESLGDKEKGELLDRLKQQANLLIRDAIWIRSLYCHLAAEWKPHIGPERLMLARAFLGELPRNEFFLAKLCDQVGRILEED